MIRKLLTPIALVLLFTLSIHAQEIDSKKHINKVLKTYTEKLQLTQEQAKTFKEILKKHNPILKDLIDQKSEDTAINKQLKLMDIEVYKVLTKEQLKDYPKVRLELESFKRYRYQK